MTGLADALMLGAGWNAALVTIGAALLGGAAGAVGTFLFLRGRALISDAIAHATLPGVGLAFLIMAGLGGDGRNLAGLMAGAAATALLGVLAVEAIGRRTRLTEDAAIGAALSVFFGAGLVILTVIQSLPAGRQAGLEGFLLGATAGMLLHEALIVAIGGAMAVAAVWTLRRPMILAAFDPGFATATGWPVRRVDLAMLAVVLAITVIGLKIVGLVLIVALLIIPPAAARFWTERAVGMTAIAGALGAAAGWVGTAISATAPALPTGPIIVLTCAALFAVSLLVAPQRGALAALVRHRLMRRRVLQRQGLLAMARGVPAADPAARAVLRGEGLIDAAGQATAAGRAAAARLMRDEARRALLRRLRPDHPALQSDDGLTPIDALLATDEIADLDRRLMRGAGS